MAKKQKKHKVINAARQQDKITWDDLMLLREQLLRSLVFAESSIKELVSKVNETRKVDNKFEELAKGVFLSLADAIKDGRAVMEQHITFGENNEVLSYKTGEPVNDDDVLDIMSIVNSYHIMTEKVNTTLSKATQEFLTIYKTGDLVNQAEKLNKLNQEYEAAKQKEEDKLKQLKEATQWQQ